MPIYVHANNGEKQLACPKYPIRSNWQNSVLWGLRQQLTGIYNVLFHKLWLPCVYYMNHLKDYNIKHYMETSYLPVLLLLTQCSSNFLSQFLAILSNLNRQIVRIDLPQLVISSVHYILFCQSLRPCLLKLLNHTHHTSKRLQCAIFK